jgi:TRAP-type transport system periplasmic protein
LKVRTASQGWVETCKAIGAVPVTLPTGEMYLALQKGIVDAVANIWDAVRVFKLKEVARYVNELYLMTTTHVYAMNKRTWEALPKAGKDYVNANWKEFSLSCARSSEVLIPEFKKEFLSAGSDREIAGFSPGELEKLNKVLKPVWDKWIADREAKGLPARKALADLYKIMTDAGQSNPIAGFTP